MSKVDKADCFVIFLLTTNENNLLEAEFANVVFFIVIGAQSVSRQSDKPGFQSAKTSSGKHSGLSGISFESDYLEIKLTCFMYIHSHGMWKRMM